MSGSSERQSLRLAVFAAMSVDGFIADDRGGIDWLEAAAGPDEDYGFGEFLAGVDALAMGRGTWDTIAHLDPLPFGSRPVFVFTHRPAPPRPGVVFVDTDPVSAVAMFAERGFGRVYVDGGRLVSSFLELDLVDELTLFTVPVLLGSGRPLFHPGSGSLRSLVLGRVETWSSGFVCRTYTRSPVEVRPPDLPAS